MCSSIFSNHQMSNEISRKKKKKRNVNRKTKSGSWNQPLRLRRSVQMLLERKIHQNWMEMHLFRTDSYAATRSRRGSRTVQSLERSITICTVYHIRRCVPPRDICIIWAKRRSEPRPVTSAGVIAVVISPRWHSKDTLARVQPVTAAADGDGAA